MSTPRHSIKRLFVLLAVPVFMVLTSESARAEQCDPAVDPQCTPVIVTNFPPIQPQYVVAYLDERQFNALLLLTAITTAITLATFVWRASTGLRLGAHR